MLLRRFLPVRGLVRGFLRWPDSIETAATAIEIIQPEEFERAPPVYFIDGQLERATDTDRRFTTVEQEVELARATVFRHWPTTKFTLKNCLVHERGADSVHFSLRKTSFESAHFLFDRIETLEAATYCMTNLSHTFFGHWLQDACVTALLAPSGEATILDSRSDWPHAAQYISAFGLSPTAGTLQFVRSLHVYQDYSLGSNKQQRSRVLRKRLEESFGEGLSAGAVYFRRGATGQRRVLANTVEIENGLAARGFDIFDLETASAADIYRRFKNATLVVSMDGSHLFHLYYCMAPGSSLITLVPADRFTMVNVGYAAAVGLRYGFIVADPSPEGYVVNMRDLLATIDLVASA